MNAPVAAVLRLPRFVSAALLLTALPAFGQYASPARYFPSGENASVAGETLFFNVRNVVVASIEWRVTKSTSNVKDYDVFGTVRNHTTACIFESPAALW